jgi:hypothetical protein
VQPVFLQNRLLQKKTNFKETGLRCIYLSVLNFKLRVVLSHIRVESTRSTVQLKGHEVYCYGENAAQSVDSTRMRAAGMYL